MPEISFQKITTTLTGMAKLVGCCPAKQKVTGSIPGQSNQSMFLSHINVSVPLFFPSFPSL